MKHRTLAIAAVAALAMPAMAQGQRMSVGTFLAKVATLKSKGMLALFSPDARLLKNEMTIVGQELQAEKKAREAAGKPPLACPPKTGGKMGTDEFIKAMETAVPPAERGIPLKQGFIRMMVARYPCPQR